MRKYSMVSHKRKNHQRWFNQYCRYINRKMEEDDLWLGRFYVSQAQTYMNWFDDNSGGIMYALIIMHDRKTGITDMKWYSGLDMDWKFWWDFNDFIIKDCDAWKEDPYKNKIDYRRNKKCSMNTK